MRQQAKLPVKSIAGCSVLVACLLLTSGHLAAAPKPASLPAQDPGPQRVETALDADASAAVVARSDKTRDALGFPVGKSRTARHVRDGFVSAEYDEVTELNAAGRVTALTQFDSAGRLRMAARLDTPPRPGAAPIGRAAALQKAHDLAAAAGLTAGSETRIDQDQATGGWTVHWPRFVDGVHVRGDENRVQVWPDGRVQSVARIEHGLASAPGQSIGRDRARQLATSTVDAWFAGRNVGYQLQSIELQWVEPNGAFDPARITSTPQPFRLAWVAQVKPAGDAASYLSLITLFVDAADGSLIGGDFVE